MLNSAIKCADQSQFCNELIQVDKETKGEDLSAFLQQNPCPELERKLTEWNFTPFNPERKLTSTVIEGVIAFAKDLQEKQMVALMPTNSPLSSDNLESFKHLDSYCRNAVIEIAKSTTNLDNYSVSRIIKFFAGDAGANDETKKWLLISADSGNANSMYLLFNIISREIHIIDEDNSFDWLLKAAEAGHFQAMKEVARRNLKGIKCEKQLDKAMEWYEKIANKYNDVESMIILASNLRKEGNHTDESRLWLERAFQDENLKSINIILKDLTEINREKFVSLFLNYSYDSFDVIYFPIDCFIYFRDDRHKYFRDDRHKEFANKLINWADEQGISSEEKQGRVRAFYALNQCYKGSRGLEITGCHLTSLPECVGELSHIYKINLSDNDLISLPLFITNLQNLEILRLEYNKIVLLPEEIGNLTNLRELNLNNNELEYLPETLANLTMLKKFEVKNNKFSSLPEVVNKMNISESEIPVIFSKNPMYLFKMNSSDIKADPIAVLNKLAIFISLPVKGKLQIHFNDQPITEDLGGPRRQVFHDLFQELVSTKYFVREGEFYIPRIQGLAEPTNLEVQLFQNLGKLMVYCLRYKIPIGVYFKEEMFEKIYKFSLNEAHDNDLYIEVQDNNGIKELWNNAKQGIFNEDAKAFCEGMDIGVPKKGESIREFQDTLLSIITPILIPLELIAKGIREYRYRIDLSQIPSERFASSLQGELNAALIISRLDFNDEKIEKDKQKWFQEWIEGASIDQLKKFVKLMTGSTTLASSGDHLRTGSTTITSSERHLRIEKNDGAIYFHTCGYQLDIPFDICSTKEELISLMLFAISREDSYDSI